MWRSVLCAVVLPFLVFSQAEAVTPNLASPQGEPASEQLRVRQFTYHSKSRRGRSEKVAIEVALMDEASASTLPAILPLNVELEGAEGFTATKFERPKTYLQIDPADGAHINGGTVRFQIRVDRKVSLGEHILNGRLRVRVVTEQGPLAPQEIKIRIPVMVVERNAKVTKTWPYHREISKGEWIMLSPVLVLMFIPMALTCSLGFHWGCM